MRWFPVLLLAACGALQAADKPAADKPGVDTVLEDLQTQYPEAQKLLGRAADGTIWAAFNLTTKQALPSGRYLFVQIDTKSGETKTTFIDMDNGGDDPVPPPPPPPPPPDDLAKQIAALVAKVNDADKKKTAAVVAETYQLLVDQVDAGTIETSETLRAGVALVKIQLALSTPPKDDAWKPFLEGIAAMLNNCAALPQCTEVLKAAVTVLKEV